MSSAVEIVRMIHQSEAELWAAVGMGPNVPHMQRSILLAEIDRLTALVDELDAELSQRSADYELANGGAA